MCKNIIRRTLGIIQEKLKQKNMASLNKILLIGRAGKDPEVRTFDGGSKLATLTLATSESYIDRSGQRQEQTEWHNLTINGKLADVAEQYIHKGSQIYVEGKIRTRSWDDQNGQKQYRTEIVVFGMQLLDPKPPQPQYQQYDSAAQPPMPPQRPPMPQAPVPPRPQQQPPMQQHLDPNNYPGDLPF